MGASAKKKKEKQKDFQVSEMISLVPHFPFDMDCGDCFDCFFFFSIQRRRTMLTHQPGLELCRNRS